MVDICIVHVLGYNRTTRQWGTIIPHFFTCYASYMTSKSLAIQCITSMIYACFAFNVLLLVNQGISSLIETMTYLLRGGRAGSTGGGYVIRICTTTRTGFFNSGIPRSTTLQFCSDSIANKSLYFAVLQNE